MRPPVTDHKLNSRRSSHSYLNPEPKGLPISGQRGCAGSNIRTLMLSPCPGSTIAHILNKDWLCCVQPGCLFQRRSFRATAQARGMQGAAAAQNQAQGALQAPPGEAGLQRRRSLLRTRAAEARMAVLERGRGKWAGRSRSNQMSAHP